MKKLISHQKNTAPPSTAHRRSLFMTSLIEAFKSSEQYLPPTTERSLYANNGALTAHLRQSAGTAIQTFLDGDHEPGHVHFATSAADIKDFISKTVKEFMVQETVCLFSELSKDLGIDSFLAVMQTSEDIKRLIRDRVREMRIGDAP